MNTQLASADQSRALAHYEQLAEQAALHRVAHDLLYALFAIAAYTNKPNSTEAARLQLIGDHARQAIAEAAKFGVEL